MKEFKNLEVIIGFIVIVILGAIALFLVIRREIKRQPSVLPNQSQEITMEEEQDSEEESLEEENLISQENRQEEIEEGSKEQVLEKISSEKKPQQEKKDEKKRYTLYSILKDEKYQSKTMKQRTTEDGQLEELYGYWDEYRLDAVADLVRLERIQKISMELEGSNKFYYYGATDPLGRPSGKGLAIYEDNTFYFGEWKEGLREGKGMWIQVAIYTEENKNANLGLVEHSYNGQWKKDLPNGEGQEHFSYNYDILKEDYLSYGFCLANVLGTFQDGYYHGEMYIMTVDERGNTTDWFGNCNMGVWEPIMKGNTTDAVWESYEKDEQGNSSYHYIYPKENKGYGIYGLMK